MGMERARLRDARQFIKYQIPSMRFWTRESLLAPTFALRTHPVVAVSWGHRRSTVNHQRPHVGYAIR